MKTEKKLFFNIKQNTMIRISVIGRLGQDAVVNNVNGKTVINFSMAYSEKFKNQQGEDVDKTTWVSCAYWTEKTNVSNYLKKGTLIYMEGKPEAKTYLNDKTKETVAQLHSRVTSLQLLSGTKDENQI
jgi:single-strand DNA-binding protein